MDNPRCAKSLVGTSIAGLAALCAHKMNSSGSQRLCQDVNEPIAQAQLFQRLGSETMFQMLAEKVKLGGATVAMVAALVCAAPTQAAIFQGDWDPAFGSDFPDLGWRGEVDVFVPNACLGLDGWVSLLQCDGMKILEAEVEFYNLNNPAITLETLFFDVPSEIVFAVNLDEGQLKGLLGGFPYDRETTLDIAGASDNAKFMLLFISDIPVLKFSSDEGSGRSAFLSTITFQLVPEPGALALLGLGLGMIGLMMRQRRRVPATAGASSSPHSAVA